MNELEDRIRDALTDRSSRGEIDPRLAPPVARRARRRQAGTILVATVSIAALVVGILGAIAFVRSDEGTPIPASVGPKRAVSLDGWTITYPAGWYLLEFPGGSELQLTNFDPAFTQPCFSGDAVPLPPHGVMLVVSRVSGGGPTAPAPLVYDPAPSACRPGGLLDQGDLAPGDPEHWSASWTDDGSEPVTADAMFGADSSSEDRTAVSDALESLALTPAWHPTAGIESTRLLLDVLQTPKGPAVLTVDRAQAPGQSDFLSVSGPFHGGGISLEDGLLDDDGATTSSGTAWGGVAWGTVTADAVTAELQTQTGERSPATLVTLPPSIGLEGQQAAWGIFTTPTEGPVNVLLFDAEGRQINDPPIPAERITIASGEDPQVGRWTFSLERTPDGIGLAFEFEEHGGGSGCCLSPLRGEDLRLDGSGSGGGRPSDITAVGSEALASVVYEAPDGTRVDGLVYDMPPNDEGIPKVVLVLVPQALGLNGTLVGYDGSGNEIARQPLGVLGG